MQILLRSDVSGLGKRGDIVEVADGYARNFLVPKGAAVKASRGVTAQASAMRRARDARDTRDRESAEAIARELVPVVIRIPARAGTEGRLFGSVTSGDVADAVAAQTGVEVDRRRVHLDDPVRSLGVHQVPVKLHPDVEFQVTIEVVPES